jgi:hypothetical protein
MPSYLVEAYTSSGHAAAIEAELGRLANRAAGVRVVRTTIVPQDEVCFHLVEASSLEAVCALFEGAGIAFDRIVEVIEDSYASSG